MDRLLATFITEARGNLEISSNCFLALEQVSTNTATLYTVFRSVHTI
jgi:chemotaxis protein histidine kinase CheA